MMEKSGDVGEFLSYGGILACRCGCLDEVLGECHSGYFWHIIMSVI